MPNSFEVRWKEHGTGSHVIITLGPTPHSYAGMADHLQASDARQAAIADVQRILQHPDDFQKLPALRQEYRLRQQASTGRQCCGGLGCGGRHLYLDGVPPTEPSITRHSVAHSLCNQSLDYLTTLSFPPFTLLTVHQVCPECGGRGPGRVDTLGPGHAPGGPGSH